MQDLKAVRRSEPTVAAQEEALPFGDELFSCRKGFPSGTEEALPHAIRLLSRAGVILSRREEGCRRDEGGEIDLQQGENRGNAVLLSKIPTLNNRRHNHPIH